jgi:hypothetical protein
LGRGSSLTRPVLVPNFPFGIHFTVLALLANLSCFEKAEKLTVMFSAPREKEGVLAKLATQ